MALSESEVGKRSAILTGAAEVFARHGYSGASVDEIARVAGASTRTIYKHFGGKVQLFAAVIRDSSAEVAEAHIALIERHLTEVSELENALFSFALDWIGPNGRHERHFVLTRMISDERNHIPLDVLHAWQEVGPMVVLRRLGERLQGLGLHIEDPVRGATQFAVLIRASNPSLSQSGPPDQDAVRAGIRTFLFGVARHQQNL